MSAEDRPTSSSVDPSTARAATTALVPPSHFPPEAALAAHPDRDVSTAGDRGSSAGQAAPEQRDREGAASGPLWQQRAEQAEQRVAQLEAALVSRATIDQAKGALGAVFGLGDDDAFHVLVRVSQHANVKLATIARRFLDAARDVRLGDDARRQVTGLLIELSGSHHDVVGPSHGLDQRSGCR